MLRYHNDTDMLSFPFHLHKEHGVIDSVYAPCISHNRRLFIMHTRVSCSSDHFIEGAQCG